MEIPEPALEGAIADMAELKEEADRDLEVILRADSLKKRILCLKSNLRRKMHIIKRLLL